jgi:uncharacterized protein
MRKLLVAATLTAGLALGAAVPVFADDLPTADQIFQAEKAQHYDQAQQMISQVLRERPNNAKAHYVQAELFAKQGYLTQARSELSEAERLDPQEKFADKGSILELKRQVGAPSHRATSATNSTAEGFAPRTGFHFPWGAILILAVVIGVLMMIFRRRPTYNQYPAGGGPGVGSPGYGPQPGYGPPPMGGGGVGSGIVGGLASGLAVGAGVVAGEELAHHFLDGDRRQGSGFVPSADANEPNPNSNGDMGGNDFGVNDPGSWDDGGGGGGGDGGGGDWS